MASIFYKNQKKVWDLFGRGQKDPNKKGGRVIGQHVWLVVKPTTDSKVVWMTQHSMESGSCLPRTKEKKEEEEEEEKTNALSSYLSCFESFSFSLSARLLSITTEPANHLESQGEKISQSEMRSARLHIPKVGLEATRSSCRPIFRATSNVNDKQSITRITLSHMIHLKVGKVNHSRERRRRRRRNPARLLDPWIICFIKKEIDLYTHQGEVGREEQKHRQRIWPARLMCARSSAAEEMMARSTHAARPGIPPSVNGSSTCTSLLDDGLLPLLWFIHEV